MDIGIIARILTSLVPYSLIVDKDIGKILWVHKGLKTLLKNDLKESTTIEALLGLSKGDFLIDIKNDIEINDNKYQLTTIDLSKDKAILYLEVVDDYDDCNVRAYCLEEIIKNLNDGILLSDKNGRVVIYNEAMEDLEKIKSKDMIGKFIWDAYEYKDSGKSEHMEVFTSRKPIIDKYKAHAFDKGKPIYKLYSTFPIIKDGETIGVYSISKDETKLQTLLSETIELKRQLRRDAKEAVIDKTNGTRFTFSDIIGSSPVMKKLIEVAQSISWLDNNILIVGETGTGKEVLAQSIHNYGKRRDKHFIGINCSAIPENLLESILFGTTKGAYTGAVDSPGLFEEAEDGTLFLDELDSMPINLQAKLLRVLQEKSARRVGGQSNYKINCKVVSSMGRDPFRLIEEGRLRQDLFYRVAGYILYLPTLKERGNDLFEFVDYFIARNNLAMNKNVCQITDKLKDLMLKSNWPGNIRQLENFIENIMVRTDEDDIYLRARNVPEYIMDTLPFQGVDMDSKPDQTLPETLDAMEKNLILERLDKNRWNVTKTAKDLGITRNSLNYKMTKYDIKRD